MSLVARQAENGELPVSPEHHESLNELASLLRSVKAMLGWSGTVRLELREWSVESETSSGPGSGPYIEEASDDRSEGSSYTQSEHG